MERSRKEMVSGESVCATESGVLCSGCEPVMVESGSGCVGNALTFPPTVKLRHPYIECGFFSSVAC